MHQRVVVTAAGVISAIGAGLEQFGCNLESGKSAAGRSALFPGVTVAEIADFNPQPWLGAKGIRVLDRSARLLAVAAKMALDDSGLSQENCETGGPDLGLVCGTVFGSVHSITSFDWSGLEDGPAWVNPAEFPNTVINAPAGQAAIKHKLRGVNSTLCAGLASGLYAIHYAAEFLRFNRARALLAGGVEELCEESVYGFSKTGVISATGVSKPFAPDRDGVVPGEGAALWMLETEEAAAHRGHAPWLEVLGFGCAQNAHSIQAFDLRGDAAAEALRQALANSGVEPEQISCIVSSASGSRAGDEMEARALECVFGARLRDVPVCAPKAAFGESMGASGAFCALVAGLSLQRQMIPPTAGYEAASTRLMLSSAPLPVCGDYALINAFGCDGNNASLVIRLWKS